VDSLDKFLGHHIDRLTADHPVPIDLGAVCTEIGAVVEEREMIPEAAMQPRDGRFHIYVQSNFKDLPGGALRRRFSWAHEIGHTLFYEQRDGELKARPDAPRGDALEAACHRAASMILIPAKALRAELQNQPLAGATQISSLAERFEVSIEVMVRRLDEFGVFENGWTAVLTRRIGRNLAIEFAAYTVWLKPYLSLPKRGVEFSLWFGATGRLDRILEKRVGDVAIKASPVEVSTSLVIFELRVHDLLVPIESLEKSLAPLPPEEILDSQSAPRKTDSG
jgi:hypothetical protein